MKAIILEPAKEKPKISSTGAASYVSSVFRKYYLVQNYKTWSDAQTYCRATYSDLATIETTAEMILLQNEVKKQKLTSRVWIGLHRNIDSWYWSLDDAPVDVMFWSFGEPNWQLEECAITNNGYWLDVLCNNMFYFVCFDGK